MANSSSSGGGNPNPFAIPGLDPPPSVPPLNPYLPPENTSQQQQNPVYTYPATQPNIGWPSNVSQQPINHAPPFGNLQHAPSFEAPAGNQNTQFAMQNPGNLNQPQYPPVGQGVNQNTQFAMQTPGNINQPQYPPVAQGVNTAGQFCPPQTPANNLNFPPSTYNPGQMPQPQQQLQNVDPSNFGVTAHSTSPQDSPEQRRKPVYKSFSEDGSSSEDETAGGGNNKVYYESESDSDDGKSPSKKHGHAPSGKKRNSHSQPQPSKGKPQSSSSKPGKISVVTDTSGLSALATFEPLSEKDPMFENIKKYVKNSRGSSGKVKVHQIFTVKKRIWQKIPNLNPFTFPEYKMMLWFKTTPKSVEHLHSGMGKCIAFYDRIARAFPVRPESLTKPLRLTLLLCSVNLGLVHKSEKGYRHFSKHTSPPQGFSSVKGMGKLSPVWGENVKDGTAIVPCGPTKEGKPFNSSTLDYSEYMVFESNNVSVKYAVDVEIHPPSK